LWFIKHNFLLYRSCLFHMLFRMLRSCVCLCKGLLHIHQVLFHYSFPILANMILGVSAGFERVLEIEGVGYRAEMNGKNLILHMGFSHPVEMQPPSGISFDVDQKARQVFVRGFDKELVGQIAANVRNVRPPEPYHGKGLHYLGEKIRRKAGKAGKAAN